MARAHDIRNLSVEGCILRLVIDGTARQFDLAKQSRRLAVATQETESTRGGFSVWLRSALAGD